MAKTPRLSDVFPKTTGPPVAAPMPPDNPNVAPSRRGRRAVTFYVDPAAHQQLRVLAVETGESAQTLITGAINELFEKHGKPRLA